MPGAAQRTSGQRGVVKDRVWECAIDEAVIVDDVGQLEYEQPGRPRLVDKRPAVVRGRGVEDDECAGGDGVPVATRGGVGSPPRWRRR